MPVAQTYQLKPGDTLSAVAKKYDLTLELLLTANQQITNPDAVQVGQLIKIPTKTPLAAGGTYDGITPAAGTISTNRAGLIFPPLTNAAESRNADDYEQLINQFAVGYNPRYLPGGGNTYCNIFVWDVTRAMDCPIPHWITKDGAIAEPFAATAYEININGGVNWMQAYGVPDHGWKKLDAATAQEYANAGKAAAALWQNPTGGHGHTAIVRPGALTAKGPATAQAGSINFNSGHLQDGFGNLKPLFYGHD